MTIAHVELVHDEAGKVLRFFKTDGEIAVPVDDQVLAALRTVLELDADRRVPEATLWSRCSNCGQRHDPSFVCAGPVQTVLIGR